MKVAILQSNYIPWKGYFDIINSADLFIFHDDLQYTKNDWRNRNKIKTANGSSWLTIPCGTNEKRLICEVEIHEKKWQKKHWSIISENYRRAKCFKKFKDFFEYFYCEKTWGNLSELNQFLIMEISKQYLNISTEFRDSREFSLTKQKGPRVLELLKKVEATEYISGPAAKRYLDEDEFDREGIKLSWVDYKNYPEYNQLYPPFEHEVSVIDLLFNEGKGSVKFLKKVC